MSNDKTINFTFNFNAPVGQNIAHADKVEVHFDKDMTMQVIDTDSIIKNNESQEEPSSLITCIEILMNEKDEEGNFLVNKGNHWIAIFRIIVDKNLGASNTDYLGFCNMIDALKPEGFRVPLKQNNLKAISKTMYHKPFDKWKYDSTYNSTRDPYDKMVKIATRFKEILEENGY